MRSIIMQTQLGVPWVLTQLFVSFLLGLAWMLWAWHWRSDGHVRPTFQFWLRTFALTAYSALGVGFLTMMLTAITLPISVERVGNVLGPWLLLVVLLAFVLKSTSFGVMLYSRHRVSSTAFNFNLLVTAIGLTMILLALTVIQSWLRVPVGATWLDGQFRVHDWFEIVFNHQFFVQLSVFVAQVLILLSCALLTVWTSQRFRQPDNEPSLAHRLAAGLIGLLGLLVLAWGLFAVALGQWPTGHTLISLLTQSQARVEFRANLGADLLLMFRVLALIWCWHLAILCVMFWQLSKSRRAQVLMYPRFVALSGLTGPVLLVLTWLFLQSNLRDVMGTEGLSQIQALVSPVGMNELWIGFVLSLGLVLMIVWGWFGLIRHALKEGIVPVHRSGVRLS
ncbi:cytochrome ubiquinol oxidase subunit I [Orrella sp. 11846]|uniref:cytochrome ubiquinol oxidase subunit I n=1 Tax=Orrella sp. 11846 TaxID=3409913 RepID=UPI003B5AE62C